MHRKLGFTLTEVLLTLVIIGIIAALTIPSAMRGVNAQDYRVGLKKGISTLNQALMSEYSITGSQIADSEYVTAKDVVDNIFAKRLNIIKRVDSGTTFGWPDGPVFYTADGMKFEIYGAKGTCDIKGEQRCFWMIIDVNGDRAPNLYTSDSTAPHDIFDAEVYSNRILPYNAASGVMFESNTNTAL